MVDAATEFRKNSFNDEDSARLAQVATMFQNISDEEITAADSASFIIAQMTAFGIEAENAMDIINQVNEVSNQFSVSSGDLANSLGVVSATSASMGNSMSETLGMMTAITEITRNANRSARGLNSIFSRLSQVLDENSSTGKALIEIYDGLGISLMDSEGQMRSTFDILSDLAKVWPTLTENEQRYIALTSAGTNQLNNFLSLMSNFDHAIEATNIALNSAGSAVQENEKYMQGLSASLQQVKALFQEWANNVLSSDVVESLLKVAEGFLRLANTDFGQFITQITLLTGLLWGGTSLINAMKILPAMIGTFSTALKGGTTAVKLFGAATKTAFPWLMAISTAITLVSKGYQFIKKKWDEAHPSIEELNAEIEENSSKIEQNKQRLEELNKIPITNRTDDIKEEIATLEEENRALKDNIELKSKDVSKKEHEEIKESDKYRIEQKGYSLSTDEFDLIGNSIEEVTLQLENMDTVSEDIRNKAAKINEEFEKTGGIVDSSIQNKIDELVNALINEGVKIEELNNGLLDYDTSIVQLVDRYDELKQRILTNNDLTDEERQEFIKLQNTLSDLHTDLDNAKNSHIKLSDAEREVYNRVNELIPSFDEMSVKVWDLGSNVDTANVYLGYLSAGMGVNKAQVDILSQAYPGLSNVISENNGMYYLNIEALDNAAKAGDQWAQKLINQQKQATQAAIEYGQARLDVLVAEAKAMGQGYGYDSDEYKKAKAEAVQQLNEIHDLQYTLNRIKAGLPSISYQPTGGIDVPKSSSSSGGGRGSSSSGGGSTSAAEKEQTDPLEERKKLYQEQVDILEHQLFLLEKQEGTEQKRIALNRQIQEYLHKQAEWYRAQGESDDSEYIRDLQSAWWELEDNITSIEESITEKNSKAFQDRLQISKDYVEDRNFYNDWGADSEIAAWKRVLEWMKTDYYEKGLITYEEYAEEYKEISKKLYEAEQKAAEEAQKRQEELLQNRIDAINNQLDKYNDKISDYETAFNYVAEKAQEEIDKLNEQYDDTEKFWDDKIQAVQDANEELDRQIELEEALDNLAKARSKRVLVYKDGRYQYVEDIDAVSSAQANLERLEREEKLRQEIENLEQMKENALDLIQDQIAYWEKYRDEWGSVVDDYQKEQDRLIAEQILGVKLEGDNWEKRLGNLSDYIQKYKDLLEEARKAQEELDYLDKVSDKNEANGALGGATSDYEQSVINSVKQQMEINAAKWHAATSQAEKDRLHKANQELGASIGATYDPDTGIWDFSNAHISGGSGSSGGSSSGNKGSSGGSSSSSGVVGDYFDKVEDSLSDAADKFGDILGGLFGKKHAKGTLNAPGGISLVGEQGPELRVLNSGDGILPSDITRNLWNWGMLSPFDLISHFDGLKMTNLDRNMSIVIQQLNLPEVRDGNDFINYFQGNIWRTVVQQFSKNS